MEAIKDKFCRDNEQASREKCEAALRDLFQDLDRKITDGVYNVPGGHQLFEGDQQALLEKYGELPGKGVMVGTRAAPLPGRGSTSHPLPPRNHFPPAAVSALDSSSTCAPTG